jgi:hypothetical protein
MGNCCGIKSVSTPTISPYYLSYHEKDLEDYFISTKQKTQTLGETFIYREGMQYQIVLPTCLTHQEEIRDYLTRWKKHFPYLLIKKPVLMENGECIEVDFYFFSKSIMENKNIFPEKVVKPPKVETVESLWEDDLGFVRDTKGRFAKS